jgi:DeoR family fructose operon transcriptional repressor
MQRDQRIKAILKELASQDFITVRDLTRHLAVSHMTVRRDLSELEQQGYLIRRYGGAIKSDAVENLFSFSQRLKTNRSQKEYVCRLAAGEVRDGETIFIDCGTTLFHLCRHLVRRKNLRVITNSLPVISELINHSHIEINLIGGEVVHKRKAVYGREAERCIEEFRADKAFIGVDGLSLENGLSTYDAREAGVTLRMAENAQAVFLLCDSTKIEKDSYYRFAPLSLFDTLITDPGLDREIHDRYMKKKIVLITA